MPKLRLRVKYLMTDNHSLVEMGLADLVFPTSTNLKSGVTGWKIMTNISCDETESVQPKIDYLPFHPNATLKIISINLHTFTHFSLSSGNGWYIWGSWNVPVRLCCTELKLFSWTQDCGLFSFELSCIGLSICSISFLQLRELLKIVVHTKNMNFKVQ